ncbi:MAG: non-canonical purine NTP pyrophosphatase [Candidatus Nitrosopolaris sp.]|jgi:XTP/dITP diphosphohydrolase
MCSLYFLSTNINKFIEIYQILHQYKVAVKFLNIKLREIQAESLSEIAEEKSKDAFKAVSKPVIIEDDGLFIHRLNGFPGSNSSFVFKTIGNVGILKLLSHLRDRSASFVSVFVYNDGNTVRTFVGKTDGKISLRIAGPGWGYDPIFIPSGFELTFGQLKDKKIRISHRGKAIAAFARWYGRNHLQVKRHHPASSQTKTTTLPLSLKP